MKIVKGICKGIDKVNDVLGNIFSVLVLGILAVIICEVRSEEHTSELQSQR